jgi:hypothetical protein
MLEGSVEEFFESDMEEKWKAILSISIVLIDKNQMDVGNRILF